MQSEKVTLDNYTQCYAVVIKLFYVYLNSNMCVVPAATWDLEDFFANQTLILWSPLPLI